MKKRFLAMLMAVVMLIGIIPTGVIADETNAPDEITYGSYNEEGKWVQTGEYSVTENGITLSKTAVRKSENTYEVTLRVETSTTTSTVAASAATVLVIDVSGSMAWCADCGAEGHCDHCTIEGPWYNRECTSHRTSRMAAAKTAAISFLDSYCDAPANSGRYVSVVQFSTNGWVAQDWIDVSGGTSSTGYTTVWDEINKMYADGGTNLDDGLYDANDQFSKSEVSGIKNKFTVALTDGVPTYARDGIGDGSNGSEEIISATTGTAATLRGNSKVYTVCFGVADDYTYETWGGSKGPTVGNFLADSVATSGCAHTADNASDLYTAFANITEDITSGLALSGSKVTDPMGSVVGTLEVSNVDEMTDGLGFTWTLGDAEITPSVDEAGNRVKTYVYTKTYTVTLNDNGYYSEVNNYPLNKSTTLTLEDGTVLQFPIPAVSPRYTVIYDNGDYGTLTGENADGQIVYGNLVRYQDTPTAPAVVPNEDYYFTGWNKTIADKVTESVTYVAQYAPKTAVTITGASGTKTYNGSEQSVDTFNYEGLPQGYTLEGVKYVAKGTDVGTYTGSFDGTDILILDENKKPVTEQFTVTLKPGELKVEPRQVILTSASAQKEYNGQPLTAESVEVTGDGFVTGEGATYAVTGTQTNVGSSVNEFTYTLDEGTKAGNYNITQNKGTLTVTGVTDKVTVTITENNGTETYDGAEKTVTGYTVRISNPLYTEKDFAFSGDATVKGTNVGTYNMELNASDFANTNKNFTNVEFVIEDGTLTINPAAVTVTITGNTDSKVYDGSEKTVEGYDVSIDNDLYTEDDFAFSGNAVVKGTDVGTYPMGLAVDQFTNNNKNFNVTFKVDDGKLNITPATDKVTVTITEKSGTETYDGTEKTVTGYTVRISNPLYTEKDFAFSGDATVKGTNAGTYNMELDDSDFANTNKNFTNVEFVIEDGTLTINPASVLVNITGNNDTKVYNGKEQEVSGYTVSISNPLYKEEYFTFANEAIAKGTEVGSYFMGLSQSNFTNNNQNFMVAVNVYDGQLEITPVTDEIIVTIKGNTDTLSYNGGEQSVSGYEVTNISSTLYTESDFAFNGVATAKGTNVGEYPMGLNAEKFANTSMNFTNVKFDVEDGVLEIVPEQVTVKVTGETNTVVYNGKEQSAEGYELASDTTLYSVENVNGPEAAIAKGTNVGEYPMGLAVDQFSNTDDNFIVTFEVTDGWLKVMPITDKVTVTITENSGSEKYDGAEKTVEGYTVEIDNELYTENDFTFSGDATVKGTDAGTYHMELKAEDFENISKNFTNVEFVIVDGTLEIAKRTVTLTSGTATKQYDRTALTKEEVTVSGDGFAEGEGATYSNFASIIDVGEVDNEFTYTLDESTKADNYVIEQKFGLLVVTKAGEVKVIITENSGEYTYDGTEKSVEGYTVALPENAPYTEVDFEFEGEALVTGTYVGEYDMELTPENFININENFENVTFVIVDGTLVIKPIETVIDITADSNEKIYDGTALTDDGYTFTENVLVEGDELVVVVEGTITDAGTVENKIVSYQVLRTAVEQRASVDVTACYTFGEITDGTLTVKPREVVITSGSDSKVYDGTPLTNCDITAEGFVKGEGAMVTFTGSQLNAGVSENTFTFVFAENTKAQNYTVIVVNGKLEVTPKAVTITSGSANKHYDGEPLTCDQITAEGFVEGEGAEYDITGSQTEVGTGKNTFTYKMKDNTLAENYTVTLVEGDLLVLPPIEIPNTGDNTNLVLYAGMMVASAAAFVTLLVAGKKKGKYTA